jgi:hypothetical protein
MKPVRNSRNGTGRLWNAASKSAIALLVSGARLSHERAAE